MGSFAFNSPTAVSRFGASVAWTIPSGGNEAKSGNFTNVGNFYTANYLRFPMPLNQFSTNDLTLGIVPDWTAADPSGAGYIVADIVGLGPSSGPTVFATAQGTAVHTYAGALPQFDVGLQTFSVANLNAGNVYLWLGFSVPVLGSWTQTGSGTVTVGGSVVTTWTGNAPNSYGQPGTQAGAVTVQIVWTFTPTGWSSTQPSWPGTLTPSNELVTTSGSIMSTLTNSLGGSLGPQFVGTSGATLATPTEAVATGGGAVQLTETVTMTGVVTTNGYTVTDRTTISIPNMVANTITIAQMSASIPSGLAGGGGSGGMTIAGGGGGATQNLGASSSGVAAVPAFAVLGM